MCSFNRRWVLLGGLLLPSAAIARVPLLGAGNNGGGGGGDLGPEVVFNGTFDNGDGWALLSGASISGGTLILNGGASRAIQSTPATEIVAGNYRASIDLISSVSQNTMSVQIGGSTLTAIAPSSSPPGNYTVDLAVPATDQNIQIRIASGVTVVVDNFSVKQIL